mmetsp:Transcript_58545/g.116091  ORF Transcript_58545/g.116091 Transcript_58545/m.116091 type:complete len:260 (-) Transcript_58545:201-980(-)
MWPPHKHRPQLVLGPTRRMCQHLKHRVSWTTVLMTNPCRHPKPQLYSVLALAKKNISAPQTPAFFDSGKEQGLPPPQTPACFGGTSSDKKSLPAPQTPAFPGEVGGGLNGKGLPPPQTPAASVAAVSAEKRNMPAPQTPAFPTDGSSETPPSDAGSARGGGGLAAGSIGVGNAVPPKPRMASASGAKLLTFNSVKKSSETTGADGKLAAAGADVPVGDKGAASDAPLPPGWTIMTSKSTGKTYFWNARLKQSTFERPTA